MLPIVSLRSRTAARIAMLLLLSLSGRPGLAQNEDAMNKAAATQRAYSSSTRTIPPERQSASSPGTNIASPGAVQRAGSIPQFQVDPYWPKPLPNNWIMGQVSGVSVDKRGHVWIIHRPLSLSDREVGAQQTPPWSKCCAARKPSLRPSRTSARRRCAAAIWRARAAAVSGVVQAA